MMKLSSLILRKINYNTNVRLISTLNIKCNKYKPPESSFLKHYTPVYKFPFVRVLSIINRLKLYHTVATVVAVPASFFLHEYNIIDMEGILIISALGITGCATLFSLGSLAYRFIGFVYLNKQENAVRVAYVNYWGRREDIEVPLKDIVPFSEVPVSFMDKFYLKFCRFSEKEILKINLNRGQILDKEKFDKVFTSFR